MVTTLGQRLKLARDHATQIMGATRLTQAKIAEMCGWGAGNQSRIGNYETDYREPSLREIKQLATAYGVSFAWLCTGSGHMLQSDDGYFIGERQQEFGARPPLITVPIITWTQAANIPQEPIPVVGSPAYTIKSCNERVFALRQQGNSMEPIMGIGCSLFAPAGCLLIADPDAALIADCFVIAKPDGYPEPICRKYMPDGGKWILVALNTQYPNIDATKNCSPIYKVIDIQIEIP